MTKFCKPYSIAHLMKMHTSRRVGSFSAVLLLTLACCFGHVCRLLAEPRLDCVEASHDFRSTGNGIAPVVIDFYYEPGCPECLRVRNEVLPDLQERYEGFFTLNQYDVGCTSNVIRLIACQDALGISENSSVSICVDYATFFGGFAAIRNGLFPCLDEHINDRLTPGWVPPEPPVEWAAKHDSGRDRVGRFTIPAVVVAGLADGINPCAISTLVFFMSLLAVAGVRGRGLLLMGTSFALASFVTYTAIGFGLLRGLHLLDSFPVLRAGFESALAVILLCLAFLSFRDAIRYKRSQDPHDVSVQLPGPIKRLVHRLLRKGVKSHHLVLSGMGVGVAVTALETVCTGQVYVPTMTLVIREGGGVRVWGLLLLYNLMFIVPLVTAMVLTRYGLTTKTMLKWSRRNVPFSKTLLGIFFLAIAVFLFRR